MKSPKSLYSRLALITSVTLVVGYFVVYAWTDLNPADAGPTKTLTATLMQGIVNNINDLNTRVSNFSFSAGAVGIGTASPQRELHINSIDGGQIMLQGTIGNWDGLQFLTTNYNGYTGLMESDGRFFIDTASNGEDLTVLQNGYVGIGTTTPTVPLSVAGAIRVNSNNSANPVCNATTNGSLWFSQGATGVADSLKVCAKDAANTYLWRILY